MGNGDGLDAHFWLSYLSEVGTGLLVRAQWEGMRIARDAEVAGSVADPLALLPEGAEVRLDQRLGDQRTVVAAWGGVLARVEGGGQVTSIDVVGRDRGEVEAAVDHLATGARRAATLPEGSVRVRFWSERDGEGSMTTRRVEAPAWPEVTANYAARTAGALGELMALPSPATRAGRLVLWHGAPGTGKTTAARALGRAWSGWCQTHYVMDPERLFDSPQYLLDVAGASDDRDDQKWRLVIAEDCDEYLRADAKLRAGASLGRLLNLCDGILGHGLRVLVLLTTNEDVGRLHPAITRPGRCLAQVEFEALSAAEARRWLGSRGTAPEGPMTLAELYAVREDRVRDPGHREEPGGYL
ncbi:DUF5925 domain-containing protein [Blastococcus sp. SYSU DS0510]